MVRVEDIKLIFRSDLDKKYRDELDRLFFFNGNQQKWEDIVERSIDEYACPVLVEEEGKVAIQFNHQEVGQTLHVMDSEKPDASLIGVVMYSRDTIDTVTLVHIVLHEQCHEILKVHHVNVGLILLQELMAHFKKIKGIERVRIYYTGKVIPVR